jgi:type I restriction enzyme M protein
MSISSTIKSIQDIMRKDVGVDGDAQRIGQLVWMFFLKIYDDKESEYELLDDAYRSPIPDSLRWRNWAADAEGITGDDLLDFVNNQLFPTLKNLQPAPHDQRGFVIRSVFEDAYNYMKSGHLMRQVINRIVGGLDFNKAQDRHLFGDLYEQILRDLQNAGNAGEYYTPRPVTQFIVDRVNPQLGEKILDPPAAPAASSPAPSNTCASSRSGPSTTSGACSRASTASKRSRCRTSCARPT